MRTETRPGAGLDRGGCGAGGSWGRPWPVGLRGGGGGLAERGLCALWDPARPGGFGVPGAAAARGSCAGLCCPVWASAVPCGPSWRCFCGPWRREVCGAAGRAELRGASRQGRAGRGTRCAAASPPHSQRCGGWGDTSRCLGPASPVGSG